MTDSLNIHGPTDDQDLSGGVHRPSVVARWWPALVGLTVGVVGLLDMQPWHRADPPTWMPIGLAGAYLVFGAARGQLHRPGVLRVELAGLVLFSAAVVLAFGVDPSAGQYVAGAAWIGHAAWDVAHHRDLSRHHAVGVVPRGWAEFCIVLDLLIGASLIAAPSI